MLVCEFFGGQPEEKLFGNGAGGGDGVELGEGRVGGEVSQQGDEGRADGFELVEVVEVGFVQVLVRVAGVVEGLLEVEDVGGGGEKGRLEGLVGQVGEGDGAEAVEELEGGKAGGGAAGESEEDGGGGGVGDFWFRFWWGVC